jgi:hypothetical protein
MRFTRWTIFFYGDWRGTPLIFFRRMPQARYIAAEVDACRSFIACRVGISSLIPLARGRN